MEGVGKDLCRSFSLTPPPKKGHLEQAAQDCARVLNISRVGHSTTSLGSLFQCSVTLKVKKFFIFTESQNHRMLGVGRDLFGSFSPIPLTKQGLL